MSVLGYVQAGGGSTRFGKDKALVELGGETILARTTKLVASVCSEAIVVAAVGKYLGGPAPLPGRSLARTGPLGGILTALQSSALRDSKPAWNLIVSCDLPFLTPEWLAFLCERAERSNAHVVVPESVRGLEPLCACWATRSTPAVKVAYDAGVRKVTEAMKQVPMEVLDEPVWKRFDTEGRLFWNMNTPADYEEAKRILEAQQP